MPTFIATDDPDLHDYMTRKGAHVVWVSEACASGSDRCALAVERLGLQTDIVVNCQCDMPFVPMSYLKYAVDVLYKGSTTIGAQWATLYAPQKTVEISDGVFKRVERDIHIGVYAFFRETLKRFTELPLTLNEKALQLEQMRLVDNDIPGIFGQVPFAPLEVNTPEDLEMVNA